MESQVKLNEKRKQNLEKFKKALPEVYKAVHDGANAPLRTDGALSAKVKRLMCLAIALGVGCHNCILAQFDGARRAGATKEELLEVLSVAAAMRGNTGVAETMRVIELMDEVGML
jgi:AhpD family alkylhydroperoxidase